MSYGTCASLEQASAISGQQAQDVASAQNIPHSACQESVFWECMEEEEADEKHPDAMDVCQDEPDSSAVLLENGAATGARSFAEDCTRCVDHGTATLDELHGSWAKARRPETKLTDLMVKEQGKVDLSYTADNTVGKPDRSGRTRTVTARGLRRFTTAQRRATAGGTGYKSGMNDLTTCLYEKAAGLGRLPWNQRDQCSAVNCGHVIAFSIGGPLNNPRNYFPQAAYSNQRKAGSWFAMEAVVRTVIAAALMLPAACPPDSLGVEVTFEYDDSQPGTSGAPSLPDSYQGNFDVPRGGIYRLHVEEACFVKGLEAQVPALIWRHGQNAANSVGSFATTFTSGPSGYSQVLKKDARTSYVRWVNAAKSEYAAFMQSGGYKVLI